MSAEDHVVVLVEGADWVRRWADAREAAVRARWFVDIVRTTVADHGGLFPIDQGVGERGLAVFAPDRGVDALRCALDLMERLSGSPRARGAIHAGPVSIAGDGVRGIALHLGSRLRSVAADGDLLVSDVAMRYLCRPTWPSEVEAVDIGHRRLRDFGPPHRLYRVRPATEPPPDTAPGRAPRPEADTVRLPPPALPTGPSAPPPQMMALLEADPFVGRDQEIAEVIGDLRQDNVRTVWLHGPSGVGKSRLAARAAALARMDGTTVLWGDTENVASGPFPAVIAAIDEYVAEMPIEAIVGSAGTVIGDLARILPSLGSFDPLAGTALDLDNADERAAHALAALLRAISRHSPVLLVIDGADALDEPTVRLIERLAADRSLHAVRVLLTATMPIGDPARPVGGAEAHRSVLPLDEPSSWQCTAAYAERAGHPVPEIDSDALRSARGLPLHLRDLALRGTSRGRATAPADVDGRADGVTLSGSTRRILTAAAVLGRWFDPALVTRVIALGSHRPASGAPDPVADTATAAADVAAALADAVRLGLLRTLDGRTYAFSHTAVRSWLMASSSATRLASLHARAAAALGADGLDHPDVEPARPSLVAQHLVEAGPAYRASAAAWCERAGRAAMVRAEFEEAYRWLGLSLEYAGVVDPGVTSTAWSPEVVDLVRSFGEAMARAGHRSAAFEVLDPLATMLDRPETARAFAAVVLSLGVGDMFGQGSAALLGRLMRAEELLEREAAGDPERIALLVSVRSRRACEEYHLRPLDLVRSRARAALELAEGSGDPTLVLDARLRAAYVDRGPGRSVALVGLRQTIADAEAHGAHHVSFLATWLSAGIHYEEGAFDRYDDVVESCRSLLGLVGGRRNEIRLRSLEAAIDIGRGRFARAEATLDPNGLQARLSGTDEADGDADVDLLILSAYLTFHRGHLGDWVDLLAMAVEENPPDDLAWPAAYAVALTSAGRRMDAAVELTARFTPEVVRGTPRDDNWSSVMALLATAASECPPTPVPMVVAELLEPLRHLFAHADPIGGGCLAGYRGKCLLAAGRHAEAEADLDLAVDRNREAGLCTYLTIALIDRALARLRVSRSWPDGAYHVDPAVDLERVTAARHDLREAVALAERIGMAAERERASGLLVLLDPVRDPGGEPRSEEGG